MYYTIYKGSILSQHIALAKETPFIDGRYLFEPGKVWFELGDTKEEALDRLKETLPSNDWIKWEEKERT